MTPWTYSCPQNDDANPAGCIDKKREMGLCATAHSPISRFLSFLKECSVGTGGFEGLQAVQDILADLDQYLRHPVFGVWGIGV